MATQLPYGSWPSPISAELLATGGTQLGGPRFVGEEVWWTEGIAAEGGRQAIVRTDGPAEAAGERRVTVLPAPFNARTRVHEYGGSSWTALPGDDADERPLVVFTNFADQRVYALVEGEEPRPLTPVGPEVETAGGPSLRWADPTPVTRADGTREVWWICEDHTGGEEGPRRDANGAPHIERYVAAVPLDGSAAEDIGAIRRVTPSSRFVAHPRLSPDGSQVAWISWEHPQMPWDGTELHLAPVEADGSVGTGIVVAGDTTTSVLQPEWLDDERLVFVSDASGWWNPWIREADGSVRPLVERAEEFAGPMWMLGMSWFQVLDADRLLVRHGTATTALGILDIRDAEITDLDLPLTSIGSAAAKRDGTLLLAGASPTHFPAIWRGRLTGEATVADLRILRSSRNDAPDASVLPTPEPIEVPLADGGVVHAILFRPHHEGCAGEDGELPPYVARVHGGPTAQVPAVLHLPTAYYTSRGIGVVEVNYGGSSGFGRAYRERLTGQWGVVDVADTVAVMEHLVEAGIADPQRLGIEGGSAGGWTTLACLTRTDTFTAGVSSFGVAELEDFISDTHDFESRYIDGLVGPYPERRDLYVERAPLSHVDELDCPVLLLQGDEDRIVPPSQSEKFADALAAKGIPHAYILFEGEQHGFRRADSIIRATEASLSFYGQVFGFCPLDVPVLELTAGE
ncbi:MAG: prolyl oligopeptidase family serine peptidase [Brachybacterium sp.]|nr:prolyl oligopeptidase family serine peptidase [Brachybacterium sp.]